MSFYFLLLRVPSNVATITQRSEAMYAIFINFLFFRDFFSEFSLLRLGQYQSVSTFSSTMWYSATPAYTWPQSVLSRSRSSILKVAYPLSTNASLQHQFEGESVAAATFCIHTRKRIDSVRLRHMACAA